MDSPRSKRMKPLSIAEYLDHLGRAPTERAPPRRESSPFRPRSLLSVQNGEPRPTPAFNGIAKADGAGNPGREGAPRRTPWERRPAPLDSSARPLPVGGEAVKPDDIMARLA